MRNKYSWTFLFVVLFAAGMYAIHDAVLSALHTPDYWSLTRQSLWGIYAFQLALTLLVVGLVYIAHWAMPRNVGFLFLALILIKGIASYLFIRNSLNILDNKFIELNFLFVFFVFLSVDVFVTYRVINQA